MHGPIERSCEAFLRDFDRHLEDHPFLLGTRPSIGDFGLIAPLYAHLYRDPYPGRMMRRIAPRVARWVERMQRPEEPMSGEFLADDEVPETGLTKSGGIRVALGDRGRVAERGSRRREMAASRPPSRRNSR